MLASPPTLEWHHDFIWLLAGIANNCNRSTQMKFLLRKKILCDFVNFASSERSEDAKSLRFIEKQKLKCARWK
jgi:hypothetical protein